MLFRSRLRGFPGVRRPGRAGAPGEAQEDYNDALFGRLHIFVRFPLPRQISSVAL